MGGTDLLRDAITLPSGDSNNAGLRHSSSSIKTGEFIVTNPHAEQRLAQVHELQPGVHRGAVGDKYDHPPLG